MRDERFALAGEPADLQSARRALTTALPRGGPAETDCYLAAFAIAGSHSLVSFVRGLRRFAELDLMTPN